MPIERPVPAATARAAGLALAAIATAVLDVGCTRTAVPQIAASRSPDGSRAAAVELTRCGDGWCEVLSVGPSPENRRVIATLAPGEHCTEIAWTRDRARVAFLIDGHQLRLYNVETSAPAGLVDLVAKDAQPTTRIARGVTFSDNGVAITFDDCPRAHSGCRPGMLALR